MGVDVAAGWGDGTHCVTRVSFASGQVEGTLTNDETKAGTERSWSNGSSDFAGRASAIGSIHGIPYVAVGGMDVWEGRHGGAGAGDGRPSRAGPTTSPSIPYGCGVKGHWA